MTPEDPRNRSRILNSFFDHRRAGWSLAFILSRVESSTPVSNKQHPNPAFSGLFGAVAQGEKFLTLA